MTPISSFLLPLTASNLFPLVVAIIILVILPSFIAVILRLFLYSRLAYIYKRVKKLIKEEKSSTELEINLEEEPEMIKNLIKRFKRASKVLEHVNTPALIDQIYSEEKVASFSCEQIDYFCRILPNLLLAFGLFGTFLGLTINLNALSHTLSQTNTSDISSLITELQKPLQGMSIAFVASLAGLGCSTGLIFFNFKVNTGLKKLQLITSLEDYLDNIYQPTVEGHSRLDKAVEKMVGEFSKFLGRFGETVRDAVESSLRDKLEEIFDANMKATKLAEEIYTGFQHASTTLDRGANIFLESTEVIKSTQFPDKLSALVEGLANAQKEFSNSLLILNDSIKFTEAATKSLDTSTNKVTDLNEQTAQVLALTQTNQQSLNDIVPLLAKAAHMFQPVIDKIDDLQNRNIFTASNLDEMKTEISQLIEAVKAHTKQVSLEIQDLCNQLVKNNAAQQIASNNYQAQAVIDRVPRVRGNLHDDLNGYSSFEKQAERLKKSEMVNLKNNLDQIDLEQKLDNYSTLDQRQLSNWQDEFQKALTTYEKQEYQEAATAINELIKMLQKSPHTPELSLLKGNSYLLKGNTYYQLKSYNVAKAAYQLVLDIFSEPELLDKASNGLLNVKNAIKTFTGKLS